MDSPVTRRLLLTLLGTQSLSALGLTIASTVATIAASRLSGRPALAGLPTTLLLLGAAFAAYPAGRFMDRFGRRKGLAIGFLLSLAGAGTTALALVIHQFALQLAGFALLGLGRGALDLGRFGAAEIVPTANRARAVSWVVLGGTVGGIGGPLFVGPMGRVAEGFGLDALSGPYLASGVMYVLGGLLVLLLLRPDPIDLGRQMAARAEAAAGPAPDGRVRSFSEVLRLPRAQVAVAAMICGQFVMMAIMTITPLHMVSHSHSLDAVAWVIAAHVLGMFGLSVVAGRAADRYGRGPAIAVGALLLTGACLMAPFVQSPFLLAVALFTLGLGWNFCYVAGSSLLADVLRPAERGRIQGSNDLLVMLTAASGSLGSGVLFGTVGYAAIALVGIALALGLLALTALLERPRLAPSGSASD
jgi:MFS family permease